MLDNTCRALFSGIIIRKSKDVMRSKQYITLHLIFHNTYSPLFSGITIKNQMM